MPSPKKEKMKKSSAPKKGSSNPKKISSDPKKGSSKSSTATKTATSTETSTEAYTQGNITVTGGAGKGATNVKIAIPGLSKGKKEDSKKSKK